MAFSFGFSGDDIDSDIDNADDIPQPLNGGVDQAGAAENNASMVGEKVQRHGLDEMLSNLPSQLSYNTISLNLRTTPESCIRLPRREVFDIRAQLMAEDGIDSNENAELISGLEEGDIQTNIYEGGFKTWECAIDLAKLLATREEGDLFRGCDSGEGEMPDIHIIELGAGTAMPSLALLNRFLLQPAPPEPPARKIHFTLADYNSPVLRLVTLPNILLLWSLITGTANPAENAGEEGNDLEVTPEVIEDFKLAISKRGISLDFISGSWCPDFVDTIFQSGLQDILISRRSRGTLVLASETIYSPASLRAFSETLVSLLRRGEGSTGSRSSARAFVAAKRVYFGVGGGVDEFLTSLSNIGENTAKVNEKFDVEDGGVGRVILDVGLVEGNC